MERSDAPEQGTPSQEHAREGNKAQWQRPELVRMGHLKEFVRGGGKSGSAFDMDPNSSGKGGLG
ncbi:MAG: hypothetical protein IPM54_23655 [Polyangiaceae bacterium]|nr:hypothetical protein [Polyangiaceae bacterium]